MMKELGIPLQRLQAETTSSEFSRYMVFQEQEERERTEKYEFYAANIIAEIRSSWVSKEDREKIDPNNFLVKPQKSTSLRTRKKKDKKKDKEKYLKDSKSHWLGLCGLNKKEN